MDRREMKKRIWAAIATGLSPDNRRSVKEEIAAARLLAFKFNTNPSRSTKQRWLMAEYDVMQICFNHSKV